MGDLISRQALCEYALNQKDKSVTPNDIMRFPSAQSERPKGEWITKSTNGEMFDCCSVCGYVEWDAPRNFCPNCGADMRGEQDG